jgi:hypothetical protein
MYGPPICPGVILRLTPTGESLIELPFKKTRRNACQCFFPLEVTSRKENLGNILDQIAPGSPKTGNNQKKTTHRRKDYWHFPPKRA